MHILTKFPCWSICSCWDIQGDAKLHHPPRNGMFRDPPRNRVKIFGRAHVAFVLNFYIAMSVSPCAKNVRRRLEAHFLKKVRKLSLDEKMYHSYKKACTLSDKIFRRHQAKMSTILSDFCLTFELKYWTKFSTDLQTKFSTLGRHFNNFVWRIFVQ